MGSKVQRFDLTNFAGGIREGDRLSASDYTDRQWAQLEGFVLENESSVRSQWALQRLSTETNFRELRGFFTQGHNWLCGIKNDGSIWYTNVPADSASAATADATVWTQIAGVPASTSRKFQCEITPYKALPANSAIATTALRCGSNGSKDVIYIVENAAGTALVAEVKNNPHATVTVNPDGQNIPVSGTHPRAYVGVMWKGYLVLGNVFWYTDAAGAAAGTGLTDANSRLHTNYLHFSVPGLPDTFDPLDVVPLGDSDTAIMSMQVCEAGLLIFTSRGNEQSGVWLMRGDPSSPTLELVRGGMGLHRSATVSRAAYWAATGDVAFVDWLGGVWHTDGNQMERLDEYGPAKPYAAQTDDNLAAHGQYLFVARKNRLLCLRAFDGVGAWTTLLGPGGLAEFDCRSLESYGMSMYFIHEGQVFRYQMEDQEYAAQERGLFQGVPQPLTVTTATIGRDEYSLTRWRRVGVRASSHATGQAVGKLVSITSYAGPRFAQPEPASHAVVLNKTVADREIEVVESVGTSLDMSVKMVFTGDLRLETVSIWYSGKKEDR